MHKIKFCRKMAKLFNITAKRNLSSLGYKVVDHQFDAIVVGAGLFFFPHKNSFYKKKISRWCGTSCCHGSIGRRNENWFVEACA